MRHFLWVIRSWWFLWKTQSFKKKRASRIDGSGLFCCIQPVSLLYINELALKVL